MKRDPRPTPYPVREHTAPDPTPPTPPAVTETVPQAGPNPEHTPEPLRPEPSDDRPRLPRREPQQNLLSQLKDEPDEDRENDVTPTENTARTLTAFHKGTRRGRGGADDDS